VFDMLGREVRTLLNEQLNAGKCIITVFRQVNILPQRN